MQKKIFKRMGFLSLILACCLMTSAVQAEAAKEVFTLRGSIHESMDEMTFTVSDTGMRETQEISGIDGMRENILQVLIEDENGNCLQTLQYHSAELPGQNVTPAFVRLADMNFDGYLDLNLLTAQGARNVFWALAVYKPEETKFDEVMQGWMFNQQKREFEFSPQMELCNYELYPEKLGVYSQVQDGFGFSYNVLYGWEGYFSLVPDTLEEIYDAGESRIGERVELYGTGKIRCWDEQYPEEWYYGQDGVAEERRQAMREMTLGSGVDNPDWRKVVNVDWVNVRARDSKESPSLDRLDAGEWVQVLSEGIGRDAGWVRVWYLKEGQGIFISSPDDGTKGVTGYIWHSFLEKEK